MRPGDSCTVAHHYGRTDTKKVMIIERVVLNTNFNSGVAVHVSGLEMPVDSGLIRDLQPAEDVDELTRAFVLKYQEMRHHRAQYQKNFNRTSLNKFMKLELELDAEAEQLNVLLKQL